MQMLALLVGWDFICGCREDKKNMFGSSAMQSFYFKILIIEQVGYLGGSSEITLMLIMYHHNIIV